MEMDTITEMNTEMEVDMEVDMDIPIHLKGKYILDKNIKKNNYKCQNLHSDSSDNIDSNIISDKTCKDKHNNQNYQNYVINQNYQKKGWHVKNNKLKDKLANRGGFLPCYICDQKKKFNEIEYCRVINYNQMPYLNQIETFNICQNNDGVRDVHQKKNVKNVYNVNCQSSNSNTGHNDYLWDDKYFFKRAENVYILCCDCVAKELVVGAPKNYKMVQQHYFNKDIHFRTQHNIIYELQFKKKSLLFQKNILEDDIKDLKEKIKQLNIDSKKFHKNVEGQST